MAGLKLQAVTKSWDGKTQVIKPLTLMWRMANYRDGRAVWLRKSTLLRMVAGLERVTTGVSGSTASVTEMEPKDRGIAMVFQNYALYPHMSGRGEHGVGLKIAAWASNKLPNVC